MEFYRALLIESALRTLESLGRNWPYLLASVVIAAALEVLIDTGGVGALLRRFRGAGVLAATAAAVATPFCSCGTTAVVLGMMAGSMPMAPIVSFMVASPLSSPGELLYSAGLFGWPFAAAYFASSVLLGLAGGAAAGVLERSGWLEGQARFGGAAADRGAGRPCCAPEGAAAPPRARPFQSPARKATAFLRAAAGIARRLMPMFAGFAFIGYLLNGLVPASWIRALFGVGNAYGVPLAATLGLPLYVNSEAALPLARSLLDSGMSPGAIMAFMIAGSGTSVGALAGALTIAKWRVVGLVAAVLWLGAILAGWAYDLLLAVGAA